MLLLFVVKLFTNASIEERSARLHSIGINLSEFNELASTALLAMFDLILLDAAPLYINFIDNCHNRERESVCEWGNIQQTRIRKAKTHHADESLLLFPLCTTSSIYIQYKKTYACGGIQPDSGIAACD